MTKINKTTLFMALALSTPLLAQPVGSIKGKVTGTSDGSAISGIGITATSDVMPKPRSTTTRADGSYHLPMLLPGNYQLTFTSADGTIRQTSVEVLLDQTSNANVQLLTTTKTRDITQNTSISPEIITITGSAIVREGNSSLTNALGEDIIKGVPVGQNYRDLMKLIPGVEYSQRATLGPSAGGSGVDNKYGFDGVDVSLPMFGNLSSEPSTHDILNVSMDRGGAKAIGFNRSGGFAINTLSKSGTNAFHGNIEYKIQNKSFVATAAGDVPKQREQKDWLTASLGGPMIKDQLFFYTSYYRPEIDRVNKETAYGPAKDFSSVRDEYFAKLTWAPSDVLLFNLSQRTSDREDKGTSVGEFNADSTSDGVTSDQDILAFTGSWLLSDATTVNFQYSRFELKSQSTPDSLLDNVTPATGDALDITDLTQLGEFNVPQLIATPTTAEELAYNAGAQALINRYGYNNDNGIATGGGTVGANATINNQNFERESFEFSVDHEMDIGNATHSLHVGFKWSEIKEQLSKLSNGWGTIDYIGGLDLAADGTPIYYQTLTEQMSLVDASGAVVPVINSSAESYNLEINDTIELGDFTYNIGVLISQDVLYGQGLREKAGTVSGFENAPGHKYEMHTIDWQDMIQPRLGITWHYSPEASVFANFASYNPEANSLARAASWDRNSARVLWVNFDENGNPLDLRDRRSSSGKFFQQGLKPRVINEFTLGASKAVSDRLYLRAHLRHRKGEHFWEDIWNSARTLSGDYGPDGGVPLHLRQLGDYIPNLAEVRNEIGGSSFVIAEVDEGFTKYWEVSFEAQWQGDRTYLNASYVWSHYYGNFDQDNTTITNDANTFIGSSWYNDDIGKYVWDNKEGTLSGDKPHLLKLYGYYTTDWQANIGAYLVYQSGQPWEKWSGDYYGQNPTSTYWVISAYAEPAGSRRSASHWQLDLNYTQDLNLSEQFTMTFRADLFNVFDRQTGYDLDPIDFNSTFGEARSHYNPRRLQLSLNVGF